MLGCHRFPIHLQPEEHYEFKLLFLYDLSPVEDHDATLHFLISATDRDPDRDGNASPSPSTHQAALRVTVEEDVWRFISSFRPWPADERSLWIRELVQRALLGMVVGVAIFVGSPIVAYWVFVNVDRIPALHSVVEWWCWLWHHTVSKLAVRRGVDSFAFVGSKSVFELTCAVMTAHGDLVLVG